VHELVIIETNLHFFGETCISHIICGLYTTWYTKLPP